MKTILVVGAVTLPLLALCMVQESPEKSKARGDFFYNWCVNASEYKDSTQAGICATASRRIADKEASLSTSLERDFQEYWHTVNKEL